MRNRASALLPLSLIAVVVLGCSSINPFSRSKEQPHASSEPKERSTTDKAVDKTIGHTTTGVPECDEVSDLIEAELNNSDDNFVVKAVKATALNRIKDGIRESVEKNKNDPVELAKTCKEFKLQFEKYKAEEEAKRNQNSR
ncbi:MAG: hypothetical protein DMF62_08350 [Acidobacteria bacterium]|nr:MAG: hypothetical protein DMF62_08350 [Acidobacteriota bacterium]